MDTQELALFEIGAIEELDALRAEWDELTDGVPSATPFQTWEWCRHMILLKSNYARLRAVGARDGAGRLVGVAPLWARPSKRLGIVALELIGSKRSTHLDWLYLDAHKVAFVRQVCGHLVRDTGWQIANFQALRYATASLIQPHLSATLEPCADNAEITLPATPGQYAQQLPSSLRDIVTAAGDKRLPMAPSVEYTLCRTTAEVQAGLPVLFDLHDRQERAAGLRSRYMHDRPWQVFSRDVSVALAQSGVVRMGFLRLDGQPAAACYDLRLHGREHFYVGACDPQFTRHQPDVLLQHWMIENAIRDGMSIYDLGKLDEAWKQQWSNTIGHTFRLMRAHTRWAGMIWDKGVAMRQIVECILRSRPVAPPLPSGFGRSVSLTKDE